MSLYLRRKISSDGENPALLSLSPTSHGFALLQPLERQGEDSLIMNAAIRFSPDMTHSHNGKCAVTRKSFLGKVSEAQRLICYKLSPFVLEARLSWNLLIWKVKERIVETLMKSSQQWLCTRVGEDGGAGERCPPHQVPLSAAPELLGDLGKASKPAQEQPLFLPCSTLHGIRDIPAWMWSKGDSSAQGYHSLEVCPTGLPWDSACWDEDPYAPKHLKDLGEIA